MCSSPNRFYEKKKEKIFSNTQSNKSRSSRYKYKLSHISFYKMPKYYNAITSLEKSVNYKKKGGRILSFDFRNKRPLHEVEATRREIEN